MSDEDIKRWIEMETLRLGLQWPGVTRVSGGAFSLWLLLGMRMLENGAADERFLVDAIYDLGRDLELPP